MFVAGAHVLLYIKLPAPMTLRFAIINVFGVAMLFGAQAAGLLLGLAAVLWLILWPITILKRRGHTRFVPWMGCLSIALLASLFIAYKLYFDTALTVGRQVDHPAKIEALYRLMRAVSFSYVFVRGIDLIRSVVWSSHRLLNPLSLTGYLGPFHMLIAGPISPYAEHVKADELQRPEPTFAHLLTCTNTIATGLFLKIVVAQAMKLFLFGVEGSIVSTSWVDSAYLLAFLFCDFAGYSLIALGIGRLLHIPTPVNFDRPYLATSVTAFWQRWHMSLGVFVRNNLFLPLQLFLARRVRRRSWVTLVGLLPLAIAFVFVAMWHRLTVSFFIWGVGMAAVMTIEKLVCNRAAVRVWLQHPRVKLASRVIGPVYTLGVIITSVHYVANEIFVG